MKRLYFSAKKMATPLTVLLSMVLTILCINLVQAVPRGGMYSWHSYTLIFKSLVFHSRGLGRRIQQESRNRRAKFLGKLQCSYMGMVAYSHPIGRYFCALYSTALMGDLY